VLVARSLVLVSTVAPAAVLRRAIRDAPRFPPVGVG
jgi:hypothetical protein